MGYFVLPEGETTLDYVKAARDNVELFLKSEGDYKYLLADFTLHSLYRAIDSLEKDNGVDHSV